jgi:hypothetical protein
MRRFGKVPQTTWLEMNESLDILASNADVGDYRGFFVRAYHIGHLLFQNVELAALVKHGDDDKRFVCSWREVAFAWTTTLLTQMIQTLIVNVPLVEYALGTVQPHYDRSFCGVTVRRPSGVWDEFRLWPDDQCVTLKGGKRT